MAHKKLSQFYLLHLCVVRVAREEDEDQIGLGWVGVEWLGLQYYIIILFYICIARASLKQIHIACQESPIQKTRLDQFFYSNIFSLFARWFQPAQTSQPTVFSSHKKPAPTSPNQHQHQPANRPIIIRTIVQTFRRNVPKTNS